MAKKNTRESEPNSINTKQKQSEAVVYSHGGAYSKLEQVFVETLCIFELITLLFYEGLEGISHCIQTTWSQES